MAIKEGAVYSQAQVDLSLKTLYATGLFADVTITPINVTVVVKVVENPRSSIASLSKETQRFPTRRWRARFS
jgi:outer membrane protein assembly factor BamA